MFLKQGNLVLLSFHVLTAASLKLTLLWDVGRIVR
jgi:hypothetical protein